MNGELLSNCMVVNSILIAGNKFSLGFCKFEGIFYIFPSKRVLRTLILSIELER